MEIEPCDQCQVLRINDIACHETGCINSHLHPVSGKPYPIDCFECGCPFVPDFKPMHKYVTCPDCLPDEV